MENCVPIAGRESQKIWRVDVLELAAAAANVKNKASVVRAKANGLTNTECNA
jgi:hypothetical protein